MPFQQRFGDWLCLWQFSIAEVLLRYLDYYALCMIVLVILTAFLSKLGVLLNYLGTYHVTGKVEVCWSFGALLC